MNVPRLSTGFVEMSTSDGKADADLKREMQLAAYKYDLSTAVKTEDLVKMYLRSGVDPKYLAIRYGVDLERCQRYVAALTKQKEARRERENTARGNTEALEGREIVNGS